MENMTTHELARKLLEGPEMAVGAAFPSLTGYVNGIHKITIARIPEKDAEETDQIEPNEVVCVLWMDEATLTANEMNINEY